MIVKVAFTDKAPPKADWAGISSKPYGIWNFPSTSFDGDFWGNGMFHSSDIVPGRNLDWLQVDFGKMVDIWRVFLLGR